MVQVALTDKINSRTATHLQRQVVMQMSDTEGRMVSGETTLADVQEGQIVVVLAVCVRRNSTGTVYALWFEACHQPAIMP